MYFADNPSSSKRSPPTDEQRLYRHLMRGYESSVRPVINSSNTVLISFRLTLNQIVDLVLEYFLVYRILKYIKTLFNVGVDIYYTKIAYTCC